MKKDKNITLQCIVNVFHSEDDNGNITLDIESMREDFEQELKRLEILVKEYNN